MGLRMEGAVSYDIVSSAESSAGKQSNMALESYLETTLKGFEAGLTVGTIASSPIVTCGIDDEPEDVLAVAKWSEFDFLPVADGSRIVAIIERRSHMRRPLDSGMLVSASQPLEHFLAAPGLLDDGYRLVIFGDRIKGIVTPSDLLRLPVRVFAFTLLSHLEQTMNRMIIQHYSCPEQWLPLLTEKRRTAIKQRQRELSEERLNPDELEFADLSDKITILSKSKLVKPNEAKRLGGISNTRNQVVHGRDYVANHAELRDFMRRLNSIPSLISTLENGATKPQAPGSAP